MEVVVCEMTSLKLCEFWIDRYGLMNFVLTTCADETSPTNQHRTNLQSSQQDPLGRTILFLLSVSLIFLDVASKYSAVYDDNTRTTRTRLVVVVVIVLRWVFMLLVPST